MEEGFKSPWRRQVALGEILSGRGGEGGRREAGERQRRQRRQTRGRQADIPKLGHLADWHFGTFAF